MALASGSHIGPYEITRLIGVGGMGEVYAALDPKLHRTVAVKVLPPLLASDPERRTRFEREARLLAALNHPNIAVIHGLEQAEADGAAALVMELVEGLTLAERLATGALPLDEALPIAKQVAEALEAAHEQGIVHRDLKPGNIKLRPDGGVKVLDFGLAKALAPDYRSSSASRAALTSLVSDRPGFVLGTPAYMSPEQARGATVDLSTDLWAFGCVLFEMLTGRQVFAGEDTTDVIAAVVRSEPDWSQLPASAPLLVRALLKQCLRKQPRQRLADARAARLAIEEAIAAPVAVDTATVSGTRSRSSWLPAAVVGLAVATLTAGLAAWLVPAREPERLVTHALLGIEPAEKLTSGVASQRPSLNMLRLSPDGRTLVFSASGSGPFSLFRRNLDQQEAVPLAGTEFAITPFFSPDGAWLAFWSARDNALRKMPLTGGPIAGIAQSTSGFLGPAGQSWGTDGTIVFSAEAFSRSDGIFRVPAAGGTPERVTKANASASERRHLLPHLLPGNKAMLYTAETEVDGVRATAVVVYRFDTGEARTLIPGAADARYVRTGHLLFMRSGTLIAAAFDPERAELRGDEVAVLADVAQSIGAYNFRDETYEGLFDVASDGTLVYIPGGIFPPLEHDLVWIDRNGVEAPAYSGGGDIIGPRLSPDGRHIAFFRSAEQRFGRSDIWVYDVERASARPVTFGGSNKWPLWSPDGTELLFARGGGAEGARLFLVPADGSKPPVPFSQSERTAATASWSNATGKIVFGTGDSRNSQIHTLLAGSDAEPELVAEGPFELFDPSFSADGRWLAYVSRESGAYEVYVQPYAARGEKTRISTAGGLAPVWSRDGRELFYMLPSRDGKVHIMAVDVDLANGLRAGRSRELFATPAMATTPLRSFDVSADGQRFLIVKPVFEGPPPVTQVRVIFNWLDELKKRVPTE